MYEHMTIKRYGAERGAAGGRKWPFALVVEADGGLPVCGRVAMTVGGKVDLDCAAVKTSK